MFSKFYSFSLKMKVVSILYFCYIFNFYRANIEVKLVDIEEVLDVIFVDKSLRLSLRLIIFRSEMLIFVLGYGYFELKLESGIKV